MVKYTGRGLVVKRPGVLSKVQMLNLVLGVGVFPFFQITGWPRFGSVRLRFGDGTVRAVPVFGSGGSSEEGVFVCFSTVSQRGRFRFRFRFLENGSGGSSSSFGSCENVSTSDFQSEVGEVVGEIGGELPAKFGRRFSSFFCCGKSSEAYSTKTPLQISPSNFTRRFWVVAGPAKTVPTVPVSGSGSVPGPP